MRLVGLSLAAMALAEQPAVYPRGLDRKKFAGKAVDHKLAVRSYQQKVAEMKMNAEIKKRNMKPEEAVEELSGSGHLSAEDKDHMMSLLGKAPRDLPESKESKESKAVRAVQHLNEMHLNLDAEKSRVEASCVVDLEHMYKTDGQYQYEMNKADAGRRKVEMDNVNLNAKINLHNSAMEDMKQKHTDEEAAAEAAYQKQLKEDYLPADADVKLYEFIANSVDENCSETPKSLAQVGTDACAAADMSVAAALESIFNNPIVLAKLQKMPKMVQERFHQELATLGDPSDVSMLEDATSFLQKPSPDAKKSEADSVPAADVSKSQWASRSDCSRQKVTCDDLRTIIGMELVCKRKLRDDEGKSLQELDELNQAAAAKNAAAQKAAQQVIADMKQEIADNNKDIADKEDLYENAEQNLMWHIDSTVEREHECHDKLDAIYGGTACACGALRTFMKKVAIKILKEAGHKVDGKKVPEEIVDCKWDLQFQPEPQCMLNDQEVRCVDGALTGDRVPHGDEAKIPKRMWVRTVSVQPNNHPIAMKCPADDALSLELPCNMFLCPVDCKMSPWSPPIDKLHTAECSNKCTSRSKGDAFRVQTREVEVDEKFDGMPCEELKKTTACTDNSNCPTDCKMAYRVKACTEACNTGTIKFHDNSRHGRGRTFNRMLMKEVAVPPSVQPPGKECPPPGKYLGRKVYDRRCARAGRSCDGKEICAVDQKDILIMYECSVGMQDGYSTAACRSATQLVINTLKKIYTSFAGVPTARVAIVKFGNGKTVRDAESGTQQIQDVEVPSLKIHPSGWTTDIGKLIELLDSDDAVDRSFGPSNLGDESSSPPPSFAQTESEEKGKYHFGFAQWNKALDKASELFSYAKDNVTGKRASALWIMTKGERVDCSHARAKAMELRKDHEVFVTVFNHKYLEKPNKFAAIKEIASYPMDVYFSTYKGFGESWTEGLIEKMIPKLCKSAISRRVVDHYLAKRSSVSAFEVRPVHLGRVCSNWTVRRLGGQNLFRRRRRRSRRVQGIHECVFRATRSRKGYKGALYIRKGRRSYCFVHKKFSTMKQVLDDGSANDATCGCSGRGGRKCNKRFARSQITGWSQMPLSTSDGNVWSAVHLRTRHDGNTPFKGIIAQDASMQWMYEEQKPGEKPPKVGQARKNKF